KETSARCYQQTLLKDSFLRRIQQGDLVIVYEQHDHMKAIKITEGSILIIYLLAPTPIVDVGSKSQDPHSLLGTSCLVMLVPNMLIYVVGRTLIRLVPNVLFLCDREDFEKIRVNSLMTVGVRDIQGEGFPNDFLGQADAVFLDLLQPWLAIPSAGKMLKPDGILCSFSLCIEQVQRSCETLNLQFRNIRKFEILLRTYEVKETTVEFSKGDEGFSFRSPPHKKRQHSTDKGNAVEASGPATFMAKPCGNLEFHSWGVFTRRITSHGMSANDMTVNG
ncbi:hypothetical protein RDABS01_000907, partial [Bienertia sinuspersici]